MAEYIYPTRVNVGDRWAENMLDSWMTSKLPLLCFPWLLFKVHTITDHSFWLYLYYSVTRSDVEALKGVIEYRVHVVDWGLEKYDRKDVYKARYDEAGTAWFLCDRFEKICKGNNRQLHLDDFAHRKNVKLVSAIRNSIPPVVCKVDLKILKSYPNV